MLHTMDIRNWCSSGGRSVAFGGCYDQIMPAQSHSHEPNKLIRWKVVWLKKLKKEKRKMFESICTAAPRSSQVVAYDPYTYSQNFDQGFAWDEPDNISRSFSVRFAHPNSNIFDLKN
ncbi:hypothetical protein Dsin_015454 [Dipteronia sinensis]|uniref:Uncharacterized protein n=1 Tax=Dipteronia sinensis TaxID=43782 RepID=A0AAE0AC58_9ROSI|nr:hypothetical protein Dsin_015454 [Dipteronia sinensis]